MARLSLVALLTIPVLAGGLSACSKSAGTKEKPDDTLGGGGKVEVPGARGGPGGPSTEGAVPSKGGDDKRFRLQPEEGQLAVEAPAGAAGAEMIAKIIVTPTKTYKVNTEFPTKLTLETLEGVTIAKAELKAGGQEKQKGDAEVFDESNLTFLVKLTPAQSGSYTVNGSFKFAVCDKAGSTCLAKKEPIAIQVAVQ